MTLSRKLFRRVALAVALLHSLNAGAIETFVHSPGTDNFNDIGFRGNAHSQSPDFTIKIIANCFSARRRPVFNPISPVGNIHFSMSLAGMMYGITFPSWIVKKVTPPAVAADTTPINLTATFPPNLPPVYTSGTIASAFATHNLVLIRSATAPAITVFDVYGNYPFGDRIARIDYLNFKYDQRRGNPCNSPYDGTPPFCVKTGYNEWDGDSPKGKIASHQVARFMARPLALFQSAMAFAGLPGYTGQDDRWHSPDMTTAGWGNPKEEDMRYTAKEDNPLTPPEEGLLGTMVSVFWSTDLKQMDIDVQMPASNNWTAHDFCAAYYSPLMLFFDETRPRFRWTSNFKMSEWNQTSWPEPGAPGYFLAFDRNKDGIINDVSELFGDQAQNSNGFLALRRHDANSDRVIDSQDPIFNRLILWRDLNGDGVSKDGPHGKEKYSMADLRIKSISLKYNLDRIIPISERAELRESSSFTYQDGAGREVNGQVIDVWLSY